VSDDDAKIFYSRGPPVEAEAQTIGGQGANEHSQRRQGSAARRRESARRRRENKTTIDGDDAYDMADVEEEYDEYEESSATDVTTTGADDTTYNYDEYDDSDYYDEYYDTDGSSDADDASNDSVTSSYATVADSPSHGIGNANADVLNDSKRRRHIRKVSRKFLRDFYELCLDYGIADGNRKTAVANKNASAAKKRKLGWRRTASATTTTTTTTTDDEVDSESDSETSDDNDNNSSSEPEILSDHRRSKPRKRDRRVDVSIPDNDGRTSFLPAGGNAGANVNMSAAENSISPSTSLEGLDDQGQRRIDRKRRSTSQSDDRRRRCMRDQHLRSQRRDDGAEGVEDKQRRLRERTLMNNAKQQLEAAGETCVRRKMLKIVALALENDKGEFSIFDMSFRRLKSLDERAAALETAKSSASAMEPSPVAAADEARIQSPAATAAWTTTTTDSKLFRRGSLNAGGEVREGITRHQMNNNNIGDLVASATTTSGCVPSEFVNSYHRAFGWLR
jgi:hypothetical protein